jgi:predicted ABC-type ATPase
MISRPEMSIIAGPPGAGKSTVFSLRAFAGSVFNADDRAAELNGSSYRSIPRELRLQVNREFEAFVRDSVANRQSFALETTLRSRVTFDQALLAKAAGFQVFMVYVALDSFESHLERVTRRANAGGHSASEMTLRHIYLNSMANLRLAMRPVESGIDVLRVFDNSSYNRPARPVLESIQGTVSNIAPDFPHWLQTALGWSDAELASHR